MPRKKVVNTGPKKEKFIPLEDEIISEERSCCSGGRNNPRGRRVSSVTGTTNS